MPSFTILGKAVVSLQTVGPKSVVLPNYRGKPKADIVN